MGDAVSDGVGVWAELVTPAGAELFVGDGLGLDRAGFERGLLLELEELLGGGRAAVAFEVFGCELVGAGLDGGASGGAAFDLPVGDGGEFDALVAAGGADAEGDASLLELVGEGPVVVGGGVHRGLVEAAGIDGEPTFAAVVVDDLDPVGDHDVVVQLRVAVAGFPVTEAGSDDAGGGVQGDAASSGAGPDHFVFEPRDGLFDGGGVRGFEVLGLLGVGDGPRDGDGFWCGEGEVEAGDTVLSLGQFGGEELGDFLGAAAAAVSFTEHDAGLAHADAGPFIGRGRLAVVLFVSGGGGVDAAS